MLGDERRGKIKFETNEPLLDSIADSRVVIESPWLPHFTYSSKPRSMAYNDAQEHVTFRANGSHLRGKLKCLHGSARSLEHNRVGHKCHQDLVASSAGNFLTSLIPKTIPYLVSYSQIASTCMDSNHSPYN